MHSKFLTRRSVLALGSGASLAVALGLRAAPEVQNKPSPEKLGIALLGLGDYATNWIAPAIASSAFGKVAGIVTGSPGKIPEWQKKYSIPDGNVYNYENLDSIADNKEIDVIYVVTPTGVHADFAIRASRAGKHVICEKPMAPTVADCTRMIDAAAAAGKTLQIGYRLYWDPYHVRLITAMRDKEFGPWKSLETGNGGNMQDFKDPKNQWRISKDLGIAGALYDLGVYAVQGAFYAAQVHPVRVTATSSTDRKDRFTEVPEHWKWTLEYPDGRKSEHFSSYGKGANYLRVGTRKGHLELDPSYGYQGQKGKTPLGPMEFEQIFQQRSQIDGQMLAIHGRAAIITPGEMGRRDIRVINAVMESADSGKPVEFGDFLY